MKACISCGATLSEYNVNDLCYACQLKSRDSKLGEHNLLVNVTELADMLREDPESVRRAHRAGKLPAPVPGRRELLWPKEVICDWIRSGYPDAITMQRSQNAIMALVRGYPVDEITFNGQYWETLDKLAQSWEPKNGKNELPHPFD